MIRLMIFFIFIFSRSSLGFEIPFFGYYKDECELNLADEPPFFVTDSYKNGDKAYEYFRKVEAPQRYWNEPREKTLFKRSIVTILPEFIHRYPDWFVRTGRDTDITFYLPIKVEATPHEDSFLSLQFYNDLKENQKKRSPELVSSTKYPHRAQVGDRGKINNESLLQPNLFYYFLTKPVWIYKENKNGLQILPLESIIKPAVNDEGKYLTCQDSCEVGEPGSICKADYLFDVVRLGSKWSTRERIRVNPYASNNLMKNLRPLPDHYYFSVSQLIKEYEKQGWISINEETPLIDQLHLVPLSYSETKTEELRVKIPMEKELALQVREKILDNENPEELTEEEENIYKYNGLPAAFNSWMYRPNAGNESLKLWDVPAFYAYMDPRAACSFSYVLKKWNEKNPEPESQIQWGEAGTHLVDEEDELNIRRSHQSGFAVDLRPMKKHLNAQGEYEHDYAPGVSYNGRGKNRYDPEKTFRLIELIREAGGLVVFNDTQTMNKDGIKRVHPLRGHNDHLHISFALDHNAFYETEEEFLIRVEKMHNSCERLTQDEKSSVDLN